MSASSRLARRRALTHVLVGNVTRAVERPLPTRLLGVWAHPDDECYLSAGLMSRVVASGGRIRLLCATRGELGTDDPDLIGTEPFARIREAELESSLAVLGVHDVRFLGRRDGSCADADLHAMAAAISDEIDDFDPDAIVTFGPDGITGHPDHRAVSRWTTAAASSGATELLYATVTDQQAERHRDVHESLGLFASLEGGRPVSVPARRVALRCSLDHGELIRKRRALSCHGSQTDALAALVGEDLYFEWWRDECFRHPTPAELTAARAAARTSDELVEAVT